MLEKWFKSESFAWAASKSVDFKTEFLKKALRQFSFPIIDKWHFYLKNYDIAQGATQTFAAENGCRLLDTVLIKDGKDRRMDLHGYSLRVVNQMELGDMFPDPDAISANTSDTDYDLMMPWVICPPRNARRADTAVAVTDLTEGGEVEVKLSAAAPTTNTTVNSGTIECWAHVVEGRSGEVRSRMQWREHTMALEDYYPVSGSLRAALGVAAIAAGGYTSWSTVTDFDSVTLDLNDIPDELVKADYVQNSHSIATTDEIQTGYAFPFRVPGYGEQFADYPDVDKLHLIIPALPSLAKLVTCAIIDRDPELSALAMRAPSVAAAEQAIVKSGYIKGANGKQTPLGAVIASGASHLVKRLPVKAATSVRDHR